MKQIPKGIQYMFVSTLCFALVGLFFKHLTRVPVSFIIFFRSISAFLVSWALLSYQKVPRWGNNWRMLSLRGLSNGVGIALFFITLVYLPLSTANVIQNSSPIFTAILGIFILQEPVSLRRWLLFLLTLVGVALTAMQYFSTTGQATYPVILGLLSALLLGVSNNLNAKLKSSEHPLVLFNYANVCIGVLTGICCLYTFVCPTPQEWLFLLALAIVGYIGEYTAIRAYQLAPVAQVSAISYLGIPCALLIDLSLGEKFQWVTFLGIGLVILGVLLSLFWEKKEKGTQLNQ